MAATEASLRLMPQAPSRHRHKTVTLHVLRQRGGVPYEAERKVCSSCRQVLDERFLKRAAA
jgi:hypothetical protein